MKTPKNIELCLTVILLLSGCGSSTAYITDTEYESMKIEKTDQESIVDLDSTDTSDGTEISYQSDIINYNGSYSIIRGAEIGNQYIYINGYCDPVSGFEVIKSGESSGIQSEYEIPEGMITLCMSIDTAGNCHALLMSYQDNQLDYQKSEICSMNPSGELIRTIDITRSVCEQNRIRPNMMAVSDKGYFYIVDELQSGHIIILDQDGKLVKDVNDEAQRFIHGIGRGGDGRIYATCEDVSIAVIRITEDGSIEGISGALPETDTLYGIVGSVPSYTCAVMSHSRGAFGIGADIGSVDEIYEEADFPYEADKFAGSGFLDDGRMVLMERYSDGQFVFRYIPLSGEK